MIHEFNGPGVSHSRGVSAGQTVTFSANGNAVLERSTDVINWQPATPGVHSGPRMAYRMRGSTGTGTLEVV